MKPLIGLFTQENCNASTLENAGKHFLLYLNGEKVADESLDELRYRCKCPVSSLVNKSQFNLVTLSPKENAAKYHIDSHTTKFSYG